MFNWNNTVLSRDISARASAIGAKAGATILVMGLFVFQFLGILITTCSATLPGEMKEGSIILLMIVSWIFVALAAIAGLVELAEH